MIYIFIIKAFSPDWDPCVAIVHDKKKKQTEAQSGKKIIRRSTLVAS